MARRPAHTFRVAEYTLRTATRPDGRVSIGALILLLTVLRRFECHDANMARELHFYKIPVHVIEPEQPTQAIERRIQWRSMIEKPVKSSRLVKQMIGEQRQAIHARG